MRPQPADTRIAAALLPFFGRLATATVAICAGLAALVLYRARWSDVQQLNAIFPYYHWKINVFFPDQLLMAWRLLAGLSLSSGLLFALFSLYKRPSPLLSWASSNGRSLRQLLTARQQQIASAVLLGLTVLRFVMSLPAVTPAYDDAASYALFVSRGILAVASYYPLPNNHVLSNGLDWLFFQVNPGFWWTMRLPVVLAATLSTGLLLRGLLRASVPFRPALLCVGLFSLSQLSLYHATVGRGYWLLTLGALLVFFSTQELSLPTPTRPPEVGWREWVIGGLIGTYAVPTFVLVLLSAGSWLGLRAAHRRDPALALRLGLATAVIGAGSLLLYAPLLLVSGWGKLVGNGFVAPLPWADFAHGLPRYLWETEGFLAGQVKAGAILSLLVLGATLWQWRRAVPGTPTNTLRELWPRLIPISLWFLAAPYLLLLLQRVFAPPRTLFYKSFLFYLLAALVVESLLRGQRFPKLRRAGLLALGLVWLTYQLSSLVRDNAMPRQHNAAYHQAYVWLAGRPPGLALVPEPTHGIFLTLYFHSESPGRSWQTDGLPQRRHRYAYVIAFPNRRGFFQPQFPFPPAFHNSEVDIYTVPPGYVFDGQPWMH